MPLCTYFINGSCRFGSKCNNDHIDLKTLLKNEADQVINGKQWMFSCFGPFKESGVMPNFIQDLSFEEVRLGFLENSKTGNLQNYIAGLANELNASMRKMNELKMPDNALLQQVASIYNASPDQNPNKPQQQPQTQAQNPFQSVFGGNAQQQQQQNVMSTANIFGGSAASNPFQQTPNSATQQQSPFSFTQNMTTQNKPSIFGGTQQSIFGSSTTQQSQQGQSIFASQSSNIFAQQPAAPQQPTSNVFGMAQTPALQPSNTSIFGATAIQQPVQNTQQSIFGASIQSQQMQVPATVPSQPSQNVFGSVPFGQSQSFSQPNSIFAAPQQPQQQTQNVFSQFSSSAPQQNPVNQSPFGAQMTQEVPQQTNVFGVVQPVQPAGMEQQQSTMGASVFQIQQNPTPAATAGNVFGGNPFQPSVQMSVDHFYSQQENLSQEDIRAFQTELFTPGKVPLVPPTKAFSLG